MARDTMFERLRGAPLLSTCTNVELRTIAKAGDLLTVAPGTVLSTPSDRPNPLLVPIDLAATALRRNGVADVDGMHGAAEVLAAVSRSDHVVATTGGAVLVIDPRRLRPLLEACPGLAYELSRHLARGLVEARD